MLITPNCEDWPLDPDDFFDPRNWKEPEPCRIYGSDDLSIFALVDAVDYPALVKMRWLPHWSRGGRKVYLRRKFTVTFHPEGEKYIHPETGKLTRNRHYNSVGEFLHHAVAKRMGLERPSPKHIMDHRNSDGFDCTRKNLRWVTHGFNGRNKHGILEHVEEGSDDAVC